jgi:hypothetical protein
MDRHNTLHKASRTELPASLDCRPDVTEAEPPMRYEPVLSLRPVLSKLTEVLGRIGVFSCGLAVIATASLLAMHVR